MNQKLKYLFIFLGAAAIVGFFVWKYVNKKTVDYSDVKPVATFTCKDLLDKSSNDTAGVRKLMKQLVQVNGQLKKLTIDSNRTTLELGDTSSMSSIVCQIDQRHVSDAANLKEGDIVDIKGIVSGFDIDTELGLGNTIQMNYCITTTNKQ